MSPSEAAGVLTISPEDIDAAFAPFVIERLAPGDPRWIDESQRLARKYAGPPKQDLRWTTPDGQRTGQLVRQGYEDTWSRVSLKAQLEGSKVVYFEWRGEGLLAHAIGRKRVHQHLLLRALDWLRPESVLEVGCGYGLNLLLLAMQRPDIGFSGIELTEAGIAAARALIADPATPAQLESFALGPLTAGAAAGIDLRQGSADALPLEDRSVDVVVTVLALEQMERIRERALRELARVARRYVVMIEPFADWNSEGHRLEYIRRHDYFAARVEDLPRYGLTPLVATADMPNKLSFRAGLVVAAVGGVD